MNKLVIKNSMLILYHYRYFLDSMLIDYFELSKRVYEKNATYAIIKALGIVFVQLFLIC